MTDTNEIAALRAALAAVTAELKQAQDAVRCGDRLLRKSHARAEAAEQALDILETHAKTEMEKAMTAEQQLAAVTAERDALVVKLADAERTIDKADEHTAWLAGEFEALRVQYDTLAAEGAALTGRGMALQAQAAACISVEPQLAAVTAERDAERLEVIRAIARKEAAMRQEHLERERAEAAEQQRDTAQAEADTLNGIVTDLIPTLVVLAHDEGQRVLAPELVAVIQRAVSSLAALSAPEGR